MRHKMLGLIAVCLLIVGFITLGTAPASNHSSAFAGGCIRVGLVLGALWLALPQLQATIARTPGWLLGWFVGKGKPPEKTNAATPPPRQRQPRRRSNT